MTKNEEKEADWTISIDAFHPLQITWPDTNVFIGVVRIQLPPHKMKLYNLAPLFEETLISGEAPIYGITFTADEPGITVGELMTMIQAMREQLEALWQAMADELEKSPPLLGSLL